MLSASAQDTNNVTPAKPERPPSAQISTFAGSDEASRQKREKAYVKLLFAQRLLVHLRRGELAQASVGPTIKQAQAALNEAVQLEPTLAEGYAALAEIALFYPPRNLDEAIRQAKMAIKVNRDNFGGHQMLARLYALKIGLTTQDIDKTFAELAIGELREVLRLVPNDAEAWAVLGELYMALGRTDEAIQAMTSWSAAPAAVSPAFFEMITGRENLTPDAAAARLGEALIKAGRRREAIAAIRRALYLDPQNESYGELLTRAVDSPGETDESIIADLRSTIAAEPQGTVVPILLARLLARAGRVNEAIQTLRAAISRRTDADKEKTISLRLTLAQTLADAERYVEAITIYEEILLEKGISESVAALNPTQKRIASELLRRIIGLYLNADKSKEALATVDRLRRHVGSEDPTVDFEEIALLRALGKRREALKVLQAARVRFPDQIEFVYQEAVVLTELGKVDEGVTLLRTRLSQQAKSTKPESSPLADIDLYLRISNLYTQAGRGADAVTAARLAVELAPDDQPDIVAAALITLSSAQERAGDARGSEESLRLVLASEPDNATALNNLGYFLVERNERLNEALEMIQRAVKTDPTNSSFLDSLGWAQFKLGQLVEAERNLSEAARRGSSSATIQEHLGDVYFDQGKKELARAQWRKSLRLLAEGEQAARIKVKLSQNSK